MKPLLVTPRSLELYIGSDGQRFTDLLKSWANVYFRRSGTADFSINGTSWIADGGVDGLLNMAGLSEPSGWFGELSAFQFKAGSTSVTKAKSELTKTPKNGKPRIGDKIRQGYRVVWFVARTLIDQDLKNFEDELKSTVSSINSNSPDPIVIDLNRLADLLSWTPSVAMQVASNPGLFLTSDAALKETPHSFLPKFVPGSHFDQLKADVINFFTSEEQSDPIKYIAGEPGIGKTRSILEAVESSDKLGGTVCYFEDPTKVGQFFTLAKQEHWRGCMIVDEFIGEAATTVSIDSKTVPSGFKVLLIGHSHTTSRISSRITNPMVPPTEDEIKQPLSENFQDLQEFRIRESVKLSKNNIRLARLICDYYRRNPGSQGIDANSLSRIVSEELDRMPFGQDALKRLALLPNLLSEETTDFCKLIEMDENEFRQACRKVSQSSALIQFNDHVAYIGSPAVAQMALLRLWDEDRDLAVRVLSNSGDFNSRILISINHLPSCNQKEEMLSFFKLPTAELKLQDLFSASVGQRFLTLLTADPDTYLPVIHRLIEENIGRLDQLPYEGVPVGRREIIWRVRDLAQFEEYFELAEEIVYLLAREEAPSAYSNIASSYWKSWFQAYFDNTVFPYEKRLDILQNRVENGDDTDRLLVTSAIGNPFPDYGDMVPSSRVGGRIAPPELNFIHHGQIVLAANRIPQIVALLLRGESEAVRLEVADTFLKHRFSWLEHGAVVQYLQIVNDDAFPINSRNRLIADTRHYVGLGDDRTEELDERVKWVRDQHVKLLNAIDVSDPILTVLEVAEHGMWRGDQPGTSDHKKLTELLSVCLANSDLFTRSLEILANPEKSGGNTFGRLVGQELTDEQFDEVINAVRQRGFSQFTFAAIRTALECNPSRDKALLSLASGCESTKPLVSISVYRMFGDSFYFKEAARLLASSSVSVRLFGGFFLHSEMEIAEEFWTFVNAVSTRVKAGEEAADEVLATIVGEFARNHIEEPRAYQAGLLALTQTESKYRRNALAEWSDVAIWLHKHFPQEILELAASREQSQFSEATRTLEKLAVDDPIGVLDALLPRFERPYEPPFMLHGSLTSVIQIIPPGIAEDWLKRQSPEVLAVFAGHLPKPYLSEGKAIVPELTRIFWNICTPDFGEAYARAQDLFGAHMFSTGVYTGHGVEMFRADAETGKQLTNDSNPAIREWASNYYHGSKHRYEDALRRVALEQARSDTGD